MRRVFLSASTSSRGEAGDRGVLGVLGVFGDLEALGGGLGDLAMAEGDPLRDDEFFTDWSIDPLKSSSMVQSGMNKKMNGIESRGITMPEVTRSGMSRSKLQFPATKSV